ncbi:tRNA dihydrouridine synthase DusB [Candidatus Uhrbacteria bacterium CG_4_10_14_0_8_um_filter_58_22]|uniref:tRNA-dihydrouridine synthase n=1 Tax=Candidatus Uhrbacteria bacterium CG_4_10_14_0_8_um_filter_58_22 TaxID=1975029 RepID=A0A2M7QAS6_9BACT|nr:MAG: tRNA dihydrouridine synthase DusB [Parcubacteria group bacterium CG1_02_58_44]PIY63224.1 MAG: tRNA dihydrouridine synthase DusB [Candidatus Uhrbacteria bacterium CG_4_10_14_0_8_um_filter_58_22]
MSDVFSWKTEKRPIVALAPMADMTDSAFCRIAKRLGCRIVFREMVSAEALVRESDRTLQMASFRDEERPIVQQLFGADPAVMAEAARRLDERFSPDTFDLNMGCPAVKIVGGFNGAALMREPRHAAEIVRAVKAATDKPVSVKTRLGWFSPTDILDFAPTIEDAGADLISVHGRTKDQGYSGSADWEMIGRAKSLVGIPMLANGDVFSPELAVKALEVTGCDGLLIARGALGNPWIFGQVEAALNGKRPDEVSDEDRDRTVLEHARLHAELYGGDRPLVTFRKHLVWYYKGLPNAKAQRELLTKVETVADLEACLGG